ncbi:uncharacterized protein A1O5_01707 [Cladophialophora psammophila CBS 110553]|uniref:Major facilitator superfamily (MFS) profile domain-containing protein n=1 Tax=Cladophialophora psammophila CBS 110553 TaxID=1182543 RepID=W9XDH0_9EURO|nr:uncharacterized protein A1O5_01707 [Cladophialophora psammophila CBS 110553]EXJ75011.1 hypothetical protein A1O5_01707 [Cladophialophora psammophila CBS 110553]
MAAFLDETWYRRDIQMSEQPDRGTRLSRILGVWQIRVHHHYFDSVRRSCMRIVTVAVKPIMVLVFIYYMAVFMWLVGINQTSSILFATARAEGGYGFGQNAVGFLFFAPITGIIAGEIFGHFFNDCIFRRSLHRHKGLFVPEYRLPTIYVGLILMVPGLVIIGEALRNHWLWVAIVFGWGMMAFGTMLCSVAITAYTLDNYPSASGEVSSLINFARLLGGFSVGYFQLDWGQKSGWDVSFGCQAAVVATATLVIIPTLHIFGAKLRRCGGELPY